jgi:glycerol-3-phosphate acyltransferase PlsY
MNHMPLLYTAAINWLPLCIAYLLGSIPFGIFVGKLGGVGDIRAIGSGNIGATNMMRTGRKGLGALTFLCDFLKGTIAVYGGLHLRRAIIDYFYPQIAAEWHVYGHEIAEIFLLSLAVVCGHIFPVWLRFKGGKGVATTLGVYLALGLIVPPALGLFIGTALSWIVIFLLTRTSSLAAILSLAISPILALLAAPPSFFIVAVFLAILVIAKHKQNIQRLLAGTEGNFRKKTP